jgi:hypothetical protein
LFEIASAVERALLIEMVVDGGMNGDEFLQTSHAAEPLYGSSPVVRNGRWEFQPDCSASGQFPACRHCRFPIAAP